jgi:4,5-dihydroxyphthalate decarboxylase
VWLRGILADAFGVRPEQVQWITFEDSHVVEYRDPPWAERAPPGKELLAMLRHGELDAVIVGNDVPNDPTLRTVFPGPEAAAESFWHKHRFLPVNHLVTVRAEIARSRPDVIFELVRMFRDAKSNAPARRDSRDPYPCERKALEPAVELALRYAVEQGLLPHRLDAASVWEGLPPGFASDQPPTTDSCG